MTARATILQRVRAGTLRSTLPATVAPPPTPVVRPPLEVCLQRFEVEASALGIDCFVEQTGAAVRSRLATVVSGVRVLSWGPEHLPYDAAQVIPDALHDDVGSHDQATADVGVTGCDGAIAETATLALFSRAGRSRTVSLLPPVHVAVVERRQLCFSMLEFLATHSGRFRDVASCTLITGPSRTADIELTLTLGIHGPGRVVIIFGP